MFESDIEKLVIEYLETQGYTYIDPEQNQGERENLTEVVLKDRLMNALKRINPELPEEAIEQAFRQIVNLPTQNLVENNEAFHRMLTEGIEVEYLRNQNSEYGGIKGNKVWLIDYKNIENNDLAVTNQFTLFPTNSIIIEDVFEGSKRPDVIIFVNGLPLVVIELKNPADEKATTQKAYTQLQNYKNIIPQLFYYNSLLVASDGLDTRAGSLTADWSRFMTWKSKDGLKEESHTTPEIETLIQGQLKPQTLLDLIKQFTVFQKIKKEDPKTGFVTIDTIKILAAYHQYYAVNKAIESTKKATSADGDRKAGVLWHTQGSGKSLSMVFYTGKIVLELDNPTVVVITDRNDLDDQLFDTFAASKQLLRQDPVQAESTAKLKELLKTTGGGVIFTTIQKFSTQGELDFELLSERRNIVVIADEAHRSHYGFAAKTTIKNEQAITTYGFAKYLRDALPNASFIGFTGTPIEKTDASTPAVFGNYIDIYDIERAVEDGATVPIYYESRLVKFQLSEYDRKMLDDEIDKLETENEISYVEQAKLKETQLESIVGNQNRIETIAKDIVDHFEKRQDAFDGKAMIVAMSRRIAVELYDEIIKLKPEWHSNDKKSGVLKVIMTSSSSDPEKWQQHHTTKSDRKTIGNRFKDIADPLKLVIVRDMWLTGFDVPCLHTMYIDKPMQGHTLMQAIARVNRVYKDKPGGLIVDYIGIASDLKEALANYTESGGKGSPMMDINEAVAIMQEKYEIVTNMFSNFEYKHYFTADTAEKLKIILFAQEYVLGLEDGKDRFIKQATSLSKAFALVVPHPKAMELKEEIGFFQAIKARLIKFEPTGTKSINEIESAVKQLIDKAMVTGTVIDIFDAAGIKKPNISVLSDDFLLEIKGMEKKNLALELLKKLLNDEIRIRSTKNMIQSRKLSEMLDDAIHRYNQKLLTSAEVIEELIRIANEIKKADERGENLGLNDDELAFYDALADNKSALEVLGDQQLRDLSRVLVQRVKANTTIDWTKKENVQARMRVIVKRLLNEYGYPPDQQKLATDIVLTQAKMLADDWSKE